MMMGRLPDFVEAATRFFAGASVNLNLDEVEQQYWDNVHDSGGETKTSWIGALAGLLHKRGNESLKKYDKGDE